MRYLLSLLLLSAFTTRAAINITGAAVDSSGEWIHIYTDDGSTNGLFNFGFATNGIPSSSTPTMTMTVPGFTTAGAATTITESFIVTKQISTNWPFQTNVFIVPTASGSYIRCALSKRVTISDTAGLLNVPANWYSNSVAVTGMTVTNNSLLTYGALRPIVMWRTIPWQLTGSNALMKAVARSYFAETNPMHYMEFWANSGAVNTTTQVVTQARIFPEAGDPVKVQEYGAVLDYGVFPQGATVTNHWTAKERRGTNVLSTITSPFPPDHPDYSYLISYCDKSNTWPAVMALVDATNGTTAGVAVTNWATLTNGSTPAFATIAQAKHAAGLTNNTVHGSNTYANCWIMFANTNEQQYAWMGGETPGTRGASGAWTHYMPLPWVNKTNVRISFTTGSTVGQKTIKDHIKGVYFDWTANSAIFGNGNGHVWIDDCLIGTNTSGSSVSLTAFTTNTFVTGSTFLRMRGTLPANISGQQYSNLRMWGNTVLGFPENTSCIWAPSLFVGNSVRPIGSQQQFILKNDQFSGRNQGLADPCFWSFNEILNQDNTVGGITTVAIGLATNLTVGAVVDCNVFETRNYATPPQFDIMQSQRNGETCTNYMSANVTCLQVYHPVFELGTNQTLVGWQDKNGIFASLGYRGDVSGQSYSATNRWGRYYSVDCEGNAMTLIGSAEIFPDMRPWSSLDSANNGFNGLRVLGITNQPALQNNILGFVDNRSAYGGSSNGFGNYLLKLDSPVHGTNAAVAVRPNNIYPHDLRGAVRGQWLNKRPDTPGAYSQNRLRGAM